MKRYINKQKYSECQVVAAINASVFLGKHYIDSDSSMYECLVDMSSARYGAAISMKAVYELLGIVPHVYSGKKTFSWIKKKVDEKFPIELVVWHRHTGFHSVLVIGAHTGMKSGYGFDKEVRVLNFRQFTGTNTWTLWKPFKACIPPRRVLNNLLTHRNVGGACRYFSAVGSTG